MFNLIIDKSRHRTKYYILRKVLILTNSKSKIIHKLSSIRQLHSVITTKPCIH